MNTPKRPFDPSREVAYNRLSRLSGKTNRSRYRMKKAEFIKFIGWCLILFLFAGLLLSEEYFWAGTLFASVCIYYWYQNYRKHYKRTHQPSVKLIMDEEEENKQPTR